MKNNKLKPCPFCGSGAALIEKPIYGYQGSVMYTVECARNCCSKHFNNNDTIYHSDNEAISNVIKQWNARG